MNTVPLSSIQEWALGQVVNSATLLGRGAELLAQPAGSIAKVPEPKGNPFNAYTSSVLSTGIVVAVLFVLLILGGLLFVNWAFLSKRRQDRTGGRNPSDVGILKENIWPEAPYEEKEFPAMDGESEEELQAQGLEVLHGADSAETGEIRRGAVASIRAYRERAKKRRHEAERLMRAGGQEGPAGVRVMHSQAGNPVIEHDIPSVEESEEIDKKKS